MSMKRYFLIAIIIYTSFISIQQRKILLLLLTTTAICHFIWTNSIAINWYWTVQSNVCSDKKRRTGKCITLLF